MSQRFDVSTLAADAYQAMLGVHTAVQHSGLDLGLLEIVRLRVSQINGCAFCVAMHVPLAHQHGVNDDQIHLLAVWHEAPVFSAEARAALAWAEALTRLNTAVVTDEAYAQVRQHFSETEVAQLSFAVAEINAWNRLMVASATPPQLSHR